MPINLESPDGGLPPDWSRFYRARGAEVSVSRPLLTGDVYAATTVAGPTGAARTRSVMVLQHPCALRKNGVDLVDRLLVAEVAPNRLLTAEEWSGFGRLMPLPDLIPDASTDKQRHQAAWFDRLYLVAPDQLGDRIACLEPIGVNLLLQRWTHHNTRVVVPTFRLDEVTGGPYEEADITEDWTEARVSPDRSMQAAQVECLGWLREPDPPGGRSRQDLLNDPQSRSTIRVAARRAWRALQQAG